MGEKSDVAIPAERIERAILLIRGQKVRLDADLAELKRKKRSERTGIVQ